jgi:hypothetical protein
VLIDDPTRDEIRGAAERIFDRGEFQQQKSLFQKILDWIARQLGGGPTTGVRTGSAPAASGLGTFLLYLFFVAVIVLLAWIVYRAVRDRVRRADVEPEEDPEPEIEEVRTRSEWQRIAEQAEAEGRWKDAILARYRELVAELVERRVADPVPGRTTGELRVDVAEHAPSVSAPFDEASTLFELPWYGDADTGPDESARFAAAAADVLAGAGRRP